MTTMVFTLDANGMAFFNHRHNPTRGIIGRMLWRLLHIEINYPITIVMNDKMWEGISFLYSFDEIIGYGYDAQYCEMARKRHQEYLTRKALPYNGVWYDVVIDNDCWPGEIDFVSNGILYGVIDNVRLA